MKNDLPFNFTVDKDSNTVLVTKQFAAKQSLVWDAFTKQEILDQWWAPKPWLSKTKYMNFETGGRRFYAMVGPEGQEHWSIQNFTSITPISNFQFVDAFTDANEKPDASMPGSTWNLDFNEANGTTTVSIAIKHSSSKDLEAILQMGFKEGFTMTLNALEELLKSQQ